MIEEIHPYLRKNYKDYLKKKIKIGFTNNFVEKEGTTESSIIIQDKCREIDVEFEVRLVKLEFGGGYTVRGIVTDRVRIGDKLRLGGFGSHSYIDESKLIEASIVKFASKHDLIICNKICSWPYGIVVATPLTEAHKRSIQ